MDHIFLTNTYARFLVDGFQALIHNSEKYKYERSPFALIKEHRTLRMDCGRQTGKSEAVDIFIRTLENKTDFAITHISHKLDYIKERRKLHKNVHWVSGSARAICNPNFVHKFRGISTERRRVFIIEECHGYNHDKFIDNILKIPFRTPPFIVVVGIQ
ncbi:hypothetical protein [Providencia phage PSTCR6]|nr:hypothetical protein [Providencia phage PSTCR6]